MTSFAVIATTFISLIPVSAVTSNEFFIFDWIGSGEFTATLNPNADFSNITEIEVPATYNDETNQGTVIFTKANIENSTITTISIPSSRTGNSGGFAGLNALKTIRYTNTSSFDFNVISFEGCSTLREIYIYAPSVTFSGKSGKNAFRTFIGYEDSKIYVTSEDVKNQIISGTSSGTAPVSEDKIIIMTSEKPNSEFTITCDSITYKTEGGLKPQANIVAGDGAITYKLFSDEACLNEYTGYSYNSPYLPIGTYYLKGFMAATDNYQNSSSKPIKVQVLPNTNVNKSTLNSIYEEANSFFEENQYYKEDYDTTAWNNVYARGGTLSKAEEIIKDTEGKFTQSEIDAAAQNLKTSFDTLKNSPADTEEALKELQNVIEQAEKIKAEVDNGEEVYTEKSYESLLNNLQNAKDLDKNLNQKNN